MYRPNAEEAELNSQWRPLTLTEILAQEQCVDACHPQASHPQRSTRPEAVPNLPPLLGSPHHREKQATIRAKREWIGAIAALEHLLKHTILPINLPIPLPTIPATELPEGSNDLGLQPSPQGVLIAGPSPVLRDSGLIQSLYCWTLMSSSAAASVQLPPSATEGTLAQTGSMRSLTLPDWEGAAQEQFCLVLTPTFSLVVVLGEDLEGFATFQFSFDPAIILKVWQAIGLRIQWSAPEELTVLTEQVQQFTPCPPDYRLVSQFSRLWLRYLPDVQPESPPSRTVVQLPKWQTRPGDGREPNESRKLGVGNPPQDVELLKAIAHEVRTPLATIRTLARLLLKRKTIPLDIRQPLEKIDRECTQQIDRFSLFFQAVELETSAPQNTGLALTTTSLSDVIQQGIPRWQQQANRLDQTLQVQMPQHMPTVVSNPAMLDQALTGLIEQFTRSLPQGSDIQLLVTQAGHQLKLQMHASPAVGQCWTQNHVKPIFRSLGKLLMFQPETGSLTLNRSVTKNLFQALGGKLIVRERPTNGETLTIFLPLCGGIEDV